MAKLERFEITEFGPFKFIGKTVYAAPGSGEIFGRFMRPDSPVPDGLDFIQVPRQFVAKSLVSGEFDDMIDKAPQLTEDAIKGQNEYEIGWCESFLGAEVYPKENIPEAGVHSVLAYYTPIRKDKPSKGISEFN